MLHLRETVPRVEVTRFQVMPSANTSFGPALSLSPDGRYLAFTATDARGHSFVWSRPLDALEARELPATDGTTLLPFWSPDSRFLVFGGGGKLKKVDIAGGPAQPICDWSLPVTGGSWSQTGVILFSSSNFGIMRVPSSGGIAAPATKLMPGEALHSHPFFLPDGRHFLYTRYSQSYGGSAIHIGSLDAKPEEQSMHRVLIAGFGTYAAGKDPNHGHILFLRDRSLMAQPFDAGELRLEGEPLLVADPVSQYATRGLFTNSSTGTLAYRSGNASALSICWYDRQGKQIGEPLSQGIYRSPSISPDGKTVALRVMDLSGNTDIWLLDLVRGGLIRFTFDPAAEGAPVWSPDGSRITFYSTRNALQDLFVREFNQMRPEQLLWHSNAAVVPSAWSPDGRYLLFSSTRRSREISVLALKPDGSPAGPETPLIPNHVSAWGAQFSPDGHWVAYVSDASGQPEIYVRPFPTPNDGGSQSMVSNGGGEQPRWNRNGKELFYRTGRNLMSVPVTPGAEFHAGIPKVLFEAPTFPGAGAISEADWDVSPDGSRFLMLSEPRNREAEPITVVLNWLAGVKR